MKSRVLKLIEIKAVYEVLKLGLPSDLSTPNEWKRLRHARIVSTVRMKEGDDCNKSLAVPFHMIGILDLRIQPEPPSNCGG
jgi:hypothetical protein